MTGLFGFGAHGGDIGEIWERVHHNRNASLSVYDEARVGLQQPPEGMPCYVGINDPWERRRTVERLRIGLAPPLIDPTAIVGRTCELGGSSVVAARVLLLREVRVGIHSHINYMASMTRTTIGDFVTVCPGVMICGDVEVGDRVLIGAGAVICNLVKIGNDVKIGAGAVVTARTEVRDGETLVGVPAAPRQVSVLKAWS